MFVILLNYIKPIAEIDKHLQVHRAFLDECYKNEYFLASGPKVPRTGGIILAKGNDKAFIEALIERDPFKIHGVAEYEIIEFHAIKGSPQLVENI